VFIVVRLARGGTVHWLAIFFTFTATLFTGVIGGGLGSALQARGITPASRAAALPAHQGDSE
jgi:hypothetical protein